MSTLKVNTIRHTGASSDAVTLATDGTCTAKITNSLSNRNKIINGAQVVDQRGLATEATPAHDAYLTDRWNAHLSQGSKYKVQQVTESPAGFTNSLKVTSLSAYTPLAADYFLINQYIEGYNMSDLGWGAVGAKTVTISFWVRSSVTGNYALALRQPWNRAQNQSYTISSADTWEKKSLTFTGDTSGTWNTTNGQGMSVGFILGGGSNYEATSGSWGAGSHFRFSGATNLVATNAATFYITGVQLETGDVATDFEHRSYGDELQRCMRYYQAFPIEPKSDSYTPINNSLVIPYNTSNAYWCPDFRPPLRAPSSVSYTGNLRFNGDGVSSVGMTGAGVFHNGCSSVFMHVNCSAGFTSTEPVILSINNDPNAKFKFDAEL